MWQHCFNSSVFGRWQPHPKTLWGCSWWQESDTCKTGLSHALICARAWKCFNCFLSGDALLSLKGRRELRRRRRDLGSNLFLTAALMWWCWNQNIVTMIYANYASMKYLSNSWKVIWGQFLRISCRLWCFSGIEVPLYYTYWNTKTCIEILLESVKYGLH